jgi:hypothetical protein
MKSKNESLPLNGLDEVGSEKDYLKDLYNLSLNCTKSGFLTKQVLEPLGKFDILEQYKALPYYRIKELHIYTSQNYNPDGIICGIGIIYEDRRNSKVIKTDIVGHSSRKSLSYVFADNEYIINISLKEKFVLFKITLTLNTGKIVHMGTEQGVKRDFQMKNQVALGFYGEFDRNIISLGIYTVEETKYNLKLIPKYRMLLLFNIAKFRKNEIDSQIFPALSPESVLIKVSNLKKVCQQKILEFICK